MDLIPERCTDKVDVYHISYGNINGTRMYGVLTMPKKEGKYPAILRVPGAGVHAMSGNVAWAAKGVIVLEIGIHGIPVMEQKPQALIKQKADRQKTPRERNKEREEEKKKKK